MVASRGSRPTVAPRGLLQHALLALRRAWQWLLGLIARHISFAQTARPPPRPPSAALLRRFAPAPAAQETPAPGGEEPC